MYGGYDYNPDLLIICPYNAEHRITKRRFQKHIVKCEKNYPENYLEICPYSAMHRFPKDEIEEHKASCPMRRMLDVAMAKSSVCSEIYGGSRSVMEMRTTINLVECWSEDDDDSGFGSIASNSPLPKEKKQLKTIGIDKDDHSKPLKAPRGYSQLMLMEDSDFEEVEEDGDDDDDHDYNSSVRSFMGMGRGILMTELTAAELLKRVGAGRGKRFNLN